MRAKQKVGLLGAVIFVLAALVGVAWAQAVPPLINYQGRLADSAGMQVNGDTVEMRFALLAGDTPGSSLLWGETHAAVSVTNGIYSVILGSVNPIPTAAFAGSTVFLEVRVRGEVFSPRQRVTSLGFAFKAADTDTLDGVDSLGFAAALHAHDGSEISSGLVAESYIDPMLARDTELAAGLTTKADKGHNHDDLYYSKAYVDALEARLAALELKLQPVTVTQAGDTVTDVYYTNVNLHIRSGSGATDGPINGRGNLIVGYNENDGDTRDGSHNLVIGWYHSYSSYGGLVAGENNSVSGPSSSVTGGSNNSAMGINSSVSGGRYNFASGDFSSVAGGGGTTAIDGNEAYSHYSAILGGWRNDTGDGTDRAVGQQSTIVGGAANRTSGLRASVLGGYGGTASGDYSSITSGLGNTAAGNYSSVTGGLNNSAPQRYSCVQGGSQNTASGSFASISGGRYNIASGDHSFVAGGGNLVASEGNEAFSHYSAILGGRGNDTGDGIDHAIGQWSTIVGGLTNRASGDLSNVLGGAQCIASGSASTISGGVENTASGSWASITAGALNIASGSGSSVTGGYNNKALQNYACVQGGENNVANGVWSSISGGYGRTVNGDLDWAACDTEYWCQQ